MTKYCTRFFIATLCFTSFFAPQSFAASDLESGVKDMAEQISKNMTSGNKKKVAIVDFSDLDGNVPVLGQFLAEELITQLFMISPGQFEVVERRQLLKLENELILSQAGFIEEKSIKKMGQVLGVDAIVTGSITDLGNTVKVNARLIGVESAKVFAVAATNIPKVGTVAELIAKTAASTPVATPASMQNTAQPTNSPSANNLPSRKIGDIVATLKNVSVSKDEIRVIIDFFNQSDEVLHVVEDHFGNGHYPSLTDENGYSFAHFGGNKGNRSAFITGVYLQPKSNSTIVLNFKTDNVDFKDIGSEFAVTIPFRLTRDKKVQEISVSFTNIKAQRR